MKIRKTVQLLKNSSTLDSLPTYILHGDFDSWTLSKSHPPSLMMPMWLNKIKQNKTTLLQNLGRTGFYWVLPVWKVLVKNCHLMLCLYKEVERNCCNNQLIWKLSISLKILTISKWTQMWFIFFLNMKSISLFQM